MMTATNMAAPKLEKPKLVDPTKLEVKFNITPLITKLNNPKVNKVIGKDSKCKIGLTRVFKIDKTKLAKTATNKLLT